MTKVTLSIVVVAGLLIAAPACGDSPADRTPVPASDAGTNAQELQIAVTADGFVPAAAKVAVGKPLTLRVTRQIEHTCATDIVIKDYGIRAALPLNETVAVTLTPGKAGKIRFACAMDMIAGELSAE